MSEKPHASCPWAVGELDRVVLFSPVDARTYAEVEAGVLWATLDDFDTTNKQGNHTISEEGMRKLIERNGIRNVRRHMAHHGRGEP